MTTLREAIEQTVAILGPEAPLCSGCVDEWTEALRILRAALAEQPTKPHWPETLAEALYRYGTDFMCHSASRGIDDIEEAGCLMVQASEKLAEQPVEQEPVEMSPEFTDTARSALLWVLWHHQGGSSPVGQPIRFALGMGAHDHLNERQVAEAKRWAAQTGSTTAEFHAPQPAIPPGYKPERPLTDEMALTLAKFAGMKFSPAQFSGVLECETDEFTLATFARLVLGFAAAPEAPQHTEPPIHAELNCVCGAEWQWMNRTWELVATAPQPAKQPLTDEEIDALELPPSGTATVRDLVRLIERAHGIGEIK